MQASQGSSLHHKKERHFNDRSKVRKKYTYERNRDITYQPNAQIDQARLAELVNSSEDAIISKDLHDTIQTWNHTAEKMFGYTANEIIGKSIFLIVPPDKYHEEKQINRKFKQGKRMKHLQTLRLAKSGRLIPVSLTISPIYDEKENIVGASKIARNITDELRFQDNLRFFSDASKQLSSSLDYKQTLQNVAKLAVPRIADWCAVDMKTDKGIEQLALTHINPKKAQWANELRAKNPLDPNAETGIPKVLRTGKLEFVPIITEAMLRESAKDDYQLELLRKLQLSSVMIVPIMFGENTLGAISFVSAESGHHFTKNDLTIAQELAARAGIAIENAKLYHEAQIAIKIRDDFISLASHELKTPLTSLKMYAQTLERQGVKNGGENIALFAKKMEKQVDNLTLLVNDLLNVSKIQHGKLEFLMKSINVNKLVKEVADMLKTTTYHKIIIDGLVKRRVYADQYRIYQVLTNLVTNAIKYSPNGEKIVIHLSANNTHAIINVEDFGIGINPKEKKKIFGQFYRAINLNEQAIPGLGMGLYISKEIIKRHNGTIKVISNEGKGSQFIFTLPLTS